MKTIYHVSELNGSDTFCGSQEYPFATINKAAKLAMPGDTVIVHEGIYREWVDPREGGLSNNERITYCAADGENPVIKGSELVTEWEKYEGTVWVAEVPNSLFGEWNPYQEYLFGDWLECPAKPLLHLGQVYLNGKAFYESPTLEECIKAEKRLLGYQAPWVKLPEYIRHPEDTVYQWYAEVGNNTTKIYANFQDYNPNQECVEINVRKCCFYPKEAGKNYITVSGFEMAQAACPFVPPTADQPGMIGPHWSKGWIIENNRLHDAKCSAISLGKDAQTGHNMYTRTRRRPGYTYQFEAVTRALSIGWSKETIGSHIVRNNVIYDCGQNGIVGHLGCVFSKIYGNEIYNIDITHEYYGHEIAGIKLHAALDVSVYNNYIHDCSLGAWFDWETQGTRISRNLFCENDRDLFIEVSHGPYIVDNNIFASGYNLDNVSQGGAYIQNLFCGTVRIDKVLDRSTPYHFPHSTKMLGTSFVYGGDDRIFRNIFLGNAKIYDGQGSHGTAVYDGHTTSLEEFTEKIQELQPGDQNLFVDVSHPVYINENVYCGEAEHFERESDFLELEKDPEIRVVKEENDIYVEISLDEKFYEFKRPILNSGNFEICRTNDQPFEESDGTMIHFNTDYCGQTRNEEGDIAGPLSGLRKGINRIKIWSLE